MPLCRFDKATGAFRSGTMFPVDVPIADHEVEVKLERYPEPGEKWDKALLKLVPDPSYVAPSPAKTLEAKLTVLEAWAVTKGYIP